MNGYAFVLSLAAMGMITGLILSVVRTVGRYLERKHPASALADLRAAVDALRLELAEQQDARQRLMDLEERVDFAERLLARERDRALPKGE
ncbi:MAG: hypothetical protein HYW52_07725 [Gemmatimonadetes bacterium]|nr:hypothetical protein [Gemmatimonadota bacterium]